MISSAVLKQIVSANEQNFLSMIHMQIQSDERITDASMPFVRRQSRSSRVRCVPPTGMDLTAVVMSSRFSSGDTTVLLAPLSTTRQVSSTAYRATAIGFGTKHTLHTSTFP